MIEALIRAAGARRHLPGHGRRPRLARPDPLRALAGDAPRRRPAGAAACRSATRFCAPLPAASICATTARSSSSTAPSPIAAARTAPTPSFWSRRASRPGSTRWSASRVRSRGRTRSCSPATGWPASTRISPICCTAPRRRPTSDSMPAQVIGTGPTVRSSAMREVFVALMFSARREIVITTPYYVPDESLQDALCTSAYRGVETTLDPAGAQRFADRQRGQPQLLRRAARRRREGLRIFRRPAAHQVVDGRRRTDADRLGQHGSPQPRPQLREQHLRA